MDPEDDPSEIGDRNEIWYSATLKSKIDLVQEILSILESALKAVSKKKNELEFIYTTRLKTGSTMDNMATFQRTLLMAKQIIKIIGDALNQYCAFDNILRTVEENKQIQENVHLVFPDLNMLNLDKVITYFQKEKIAEWNAIKQKVQDFNCASSSLKNGNSVPVMSRLLQVKLSTTEKGTVLNESNISLIRPGVKRPLNAEDINSRPEKFVRLSCNKSDVAATVALQNDPLQIIRNLCHSQGQQVVEVVDYGMSEENRIVNQSNFSHIINGEVQGPSQSYPNANTYYNTTVSNNTLSPMQCTSSSLQNNCYTNCTSINSQYVSSNVNINYSRDSGSNNFPLRNNQRQPQVYSINPIEVNSNLAPVSQSVMYNIQPHGIYHSQSHIVINQPQNSNQSQLRSVSHSQSYSNQPQRFNNLSQATGYRNSDQSQIPYQITNNPSEVNALDQTNSTYVDTSNYSMHPQPSSSSKTISYPQYFTAPIPYTQENLNNHITNQNVNQEIRPNTEEVGNQILSATNQIFNPNMRPSTIVSDETNMTPGNLALRDLLERRNSSDLVENDSTASSSSSINLQRPSVIQKSPRKTFTAETNKNISEIKQIASTDLFKDIQDLLDVAAQDTVRSSSIIPQKLAEVITIEDEDSFEKLNLKKTLLIGIKDWGLSRPKPFQMEGIKALMNGQDTVLQCNHSEGKTTVAIIAVIQNVNEMSQASQAIILTSSKENSLSIHEKISSVGALTKISSICVDNTSSSAYQSTKDCCQVIVGIPENVLSYLQKHNFRTETIKSLCIDSADILLENGGLHNVVKILYALNGDTQVSMMVMRKTETVIAFSKRLRNPVDIESPPINGNIEDVPVTTESKIAKESLSVIESRDESVRPAVGEESPSTPRNCIDDEIAGPSQTCPDSRLSEIIYVKPKYVFKVKSILKHISVVEVNAELPNGEEIELELKNGGSVDPEDLLDPEVDPLAIDEKEASNVVEDELDPEEMTRRLKSQTLLQTNPKLNMAFPEDVQTTLAAFLLEDDAVANVKIETTTPQLTTTVPMARKVSCRSQKPEDNVLMDRKEFLEKKHYYVILEEEDLKVETLSLFNIEQSRAIIFCNSCEKAEWLSTKLRQKSLFPQVVHKHISAKERDTILKTFEMEVCKVLICTDNVLTEVSKFAVPLVINYDMPAIPVNYFWRSRFATENISAPSRKATMVVSFIRENNLRLIYHIQKTYGVKILPMMEERSWSRASSVCSNVEVDCESPD